MIVTKTNQHRKKDDFRCLRFCPAAALHNQLVFVASLLVSGAISSEVGWTFWCEINDETDEPPVRDRKGSVKKIATVCCCCYCWWWLLDTRGVRSFLFAVVSILVDKVQLFAIVLLSGGKQTGGHVTPRWSEGARAGQNLVLWLHAVNNTWSCRHTWDSSWSPDQFEGSQSRLEL